MRGILCSSAPGHSVALEHVSCRFGASLSLPLSLEVADRALTHAVNCADKIANLDLKSTQREFTNEESYVSSR